MNKKWRNIHNFVNIHQIVIGTIHLSVTNFSPSSESIKDQLFLWSMCWSLCATMLAYTKLVLIIPGKISYEKRKALAFGNGSFLIAEAIVYLMVPRIYNFRKYYINIPYFVVIMLLMTFNICTLFRVISSVLSCCKRKINRSGGGMRIISVVGIAILCDMFVVTIILSVLINLVIPWDFDLFSVVFDFRLIPHTMVILFNKSSMDHWKKVIRDRRQRALNRMI